MPKIIEDVREDVLALSRRILLEEGPQALVIRRVASDLGLATGTIYNYFPSKDVLLAEIMLEDWQGLSTDFEKKLPGLSGIDGLAVLYGLVEEYSARFAPTWQTYTGNVEVRRRQYHGVLVRQIARYMDILFGFSNRPGTSGKGIPPETFLAELVLYFASEGQRPFEDIKSYLINLIS